MSPRPALQTPLIPEADRVSMRTLMTFTTETNICPENFKRAIWRRTLYRLLAWGVQQFGADAAIQTVRQVQANLANEVHQ